MNRKLTFLLLAFILGFVGCTKDDSLKENELDIAMTAVINEFDGSEIKNSWNYEGLPGFNPGMVMQIAEGSDLTYSFAAKDKNNRDLVISIFLYRLEESASIIEEKEYTTDDLDFRIAAGISLSSSHYVSNPLPDKQYNGEEITPYCRIRIMKITEDYLEAEFDFDAYVNTHNEPVEKVTVRNGKIQGKIWRS